MKQRRHGIKVQNWHRPLAPNALRRRFVTCRDRDCPRDVAWDDNYYDCYDRIWDDWFPELNGGPEDLSRFEFDSFVENCLSGSPLISLPLADHPPETPPIGDQMPREHLLAGLTEHSQMIARFSTAAADSSPIGQLLNAPGTLDALRRIRSSFTERHLVSTACEFFRFWIRNPIDFQGGDSKSFLDHLFVKYQPPEFLYREWTSEKPATKWICWFILLSQGGDLKQAADQFGWVVPRRLIQFLYQAPVSLPAAAACVYAEVRRRGGTDADARRLLRHPAFVLDPTEPADAFFWTFWKEAVSWLIEQGRRLTDTEIDLVLDWSMHEHTEAARYRQTFTLRRRSARACLALAREYREHLAKPWARFRWSSHGWGHVVSEANGTRWEFEELTSGDELQLEGDSLHHCVVTYSRLCSEGSTAIVSLKRDGLRCITIEVDPRNLTIRQARGRYNRAADSQERAIISTWLEVIRSTVDPRHDH